MFEDIVKKEEGRMLKVTWTAELDKELEQIYEIKSEYCEHLERQISKLANFIQKDYSGLISEGGACEVAVRIIMHLQNQLNMLIQHHEDGHHPQEEIS